MTKKETQMQNNMIDATLRAFLSREFTYYKSVGFDLIDMPKYTPEIDFEESFIDDAQIFRDNFQTIHKQYENNNKVELNPWVAMAFNRDAVVPSLRRRNQRMLTYVFFDEKTQKTRQSVLRLCETNLIICAFCNTATIMSLFEQRNIVDRGHDVPLQVSINNRYITKGLNLTATYPWEHNLSPLGLTTHGGLFSFQYGVRLTFPVISPVDEDFVGIKKIRIKVVVG